MKPTYSVCVVSPGDILCESPEILKKKNKKEAKQQQGEVNNAKIGKLVEITKTLLYKSNTSDIKGNTQEKTITNEKVGAKSILFTDNIMAKDKTTLIQH
ncbi:Hypothetical predicted protein [Mytilus galloprovincialis]|uniref:Uncharacterized protein n=1 Tax=Mytilus galloprovincialis TaxID=29158 RepID=A0A8B6GWG2_MYTGA|nr:Hypothetical predicted protein [Mytilus galloprovincialis]